MGCFLSWCIWVFGRVLERLRMWRDRPQLTRKPNLWRLVSRHPPLYHRSFVWRLNILLPHLSLLFSVQLGAAWEISRLALRTLPSRRRRRTRSGLRRSGHVDRPRRSRSRRRLHAAKQRQQEHPPHSLLRAPVLFRARLPQFSRPRSTRWVLLVLLSDHQTLKGSFNILAVLNGCNVSLKLLGLCEHYRV